MIAERTDPEGGREFAELVKFGGELGRTHKLGSYVRRPRADRRDAFASTGNRCATSLQMVPPRGAECVIVHDHMSPAPWECVGFDTNLCG